MKEFEIKERKLTIKCCAPRNMSSCTDDELRLSIVTFRNAIVNITVCMNKLERELQRRGSTTTSLLKSIRENQPQELLELATIKG
ncbi:MAG: hypothetical protein ACFFFK_08905 [Candidatus Thorarchaeota archaeon]